MQANDLAAAEKDAEEGIARLQVSSFLTGFSKTAQETLKHLKQRIPNPGS